ncbi:phthalate 3,4-dioxygenase ferredoxin component [Myxococcaceae bacterium]|jgi:ferredoxin|nr:phthalate 3,4-dioxygenase ferredoxin component [Myxococcaceae bacterium]
MRVVVNFELCEANARCMAACPEVFEVDDGDQLHVLIANPPESLRAKVEKAAASCPRAAIRIAEN